MSELLQHLETLQPSELVERLLERIRVIQDTKGRLENEFTTLEARKAQVLHLSEIDEGRMVELRSQAAAIQVEQQQLEAFIERSPGLREALQQRLSALAENPAPERPSLQLGPAGRPIDVMQTGTIACCACGVQTEVNEGRVCLNCLNMDITQGIPLTEVVNQCRSCHRYEKDGTAYLRVEWESRELLALCVKKVEDKLKSKGLRLVDTKFIWTESHSRRIKVQLVVEKDVFRGATLRQTMVIEYVVGHKQCAECTKSVTPHLWIAKVQVRQRTKHKRTMLFLEQLVLKHKAHSECVNIIDNPDGMDFCFHRVADAVHFMEWLKAFFPIRIGKENKQLISHDSKSNTAHNKSTYSVEIAPICRDDLVWIPTSTASQLGGKSQIMMCNKITNGIHLVDPYTLDGVDIAGEQFWKKSDRQRPVPLMTRGDLVQFMVLCVKELTLDDLKTSGVPGRYLYGMMETNEQKSTVKKAWGAHHQFKLAQVEIARLSDLGVRDEIIETRTHLGALLQAGDIVLGYDLTRTDNDVEISQYLEKRVPYGVVLVRKQQAAKTRAWVLKQLNKTVETTRNQPVTRQEDIEAFKAELEDHEDLRQHVDIYRNPKLAKTSPDQGLIRLLEGLSLAEETL